MSSPDFEPVEDIDPDVWYHVTEERVDNYEKESFGSQLQILDSGDLRVFGTKDHYWQFQPVDTDDHKNRYSLRCSNAGIFKQLSVCRVPDDISNGKTQACMAASNGLDEQKWEIANWGNDTYRFINVKNGSDYWLDVHPGSALFMSDNIDTDTYQPAQRWLMTSAKKVNDGAFSTVFSNTPTSSESTAAATTSGTSSTITSSSSSSSQTESTSTGISDPSQNNEDSSGGLSGGQAAGIGIGVGLGVVVLALIGAFFWRRHRKAAQPVPYQPEHLNKHNMGHPNPYPPSAYSQQPVYYGEAYPSHPSPSASTSVSPHPPPPQPPPQELSSTRTPPVELQS